MLNLSTLSLSDLKVLSTALAQFADNQCEIEIEERGEPAEAIRAREMMDAVDAEMVARLGE